MGNYFAPIATSGYSTGMKWDSLCDDKSLEDIPYRVELTRQGQLVMSPHRSYHSIYLNRWFETQGFDRLEKAQAK